MFIAALGVVTVLDIVSATGSRAIGVLAVLLFVVLFMIGIVGALGIRPRQ